MVIEHTLFNHFKQSFEVIVNKDLNFILEELSSLPLPKLSSQQLDFFYKPITNEEIECTDFQLGPHKAPSLDGIPAFFYQEFWRIVKNDIINSSPAFFHSDFLLKSLNHTYITLIPKDPYLEEVSRFRPISLCNIIYKVLSKLMVNKLKPLIENLMTPFQNAFIQGRNITNNILIAHELFDYLGKKKGRKNCFGAVKIDMTKAYDRVD